MTNLAFGSNEVVLQIARNKSVSDLLYEYKLAFEETTTAKKINLRGTVISDRG